MKICVYGAASDKINDKYKEAGKLLGEKLAKRGHGLVFGAGDNGVMGSVARGVYEQGGELIGVSPRFFNVDGILFGHCTELIYTETMRERKAIMEDKSDVFIICAGGIGTFEEFFEVLTLKQLHRHSKQIIVYNVDGYYDSMLAMMQNAVDEKFMSDDCNRLYTVASTEKQVFEQINNYVPYSYNKYGN